MGQYKENFEVLNSVSINPSHLSMNVGDIKTLYAVYNPPTYPNTSGVWNYDRDFIDRKNETDTVFIFSAKKEGNTTVSYTPDDNPSLITYCNIIISKTPLEEIHLDPKFETSSKGKQFEIAINYVPDGAPHSGNWSYDTTKFLLLDSSTPDLARFQVLSSEPSSLPLTYSSGLVSDTNMCTILNVPAQAVKLDPKEEYVSIGKDFYIDISYEPSNADHFGIWKYDKTKLSLLPDSTYEKAHFTTLDSTTKGGIELTYISGNVLDTNRCYISTQALNGLELNPTKETVSKGNTFKIEIIYDPDDANHIGTWTYDETLLRYEDESTVDVAYFTVIGESSDPVILTYTSADKVATNTCTISTYDILQEIKLNPTEETVKVGDTFEIGIEYIPDSAPHMGMWAYDTEFLEQDEDKSTPEKGVFKVLKNAKSIQRLTYGANKIRATNFCTIAFDDLIELKLDPTEETVDVGDSFTIDVTYVPDSAQHNARWRFDGDIFKMVDYTPDQATFKVLAPSSEVQSLICYSNDISSTNSCTINSVTPDLKQIILDPKTESVSVGDMFEIAIQYIPDDAIHQGEWEYDKSIFELEDSSTVDKAVFKVIADFNDDQTLKYSYNNISDTNICSKKQNKLESIIVNPVYSNMYVGKEDTYYVSFIPDSASHKGEWWYDKNIFDLVSDNNTSDVLVIRAKKSTGSTSTPVVFIPEENPQLAKGSIVTVK